MTDRMKIKCIQMDMAFCSPDKNFERAERLIGDAMIDSPDVIVLPEMWNTGFFPRDELAKYSDKGGVKTKFVIGGLAEKYGVNIVAGSVSNVKEDKIYNTAYVFDRMGKVVGEYDKTHLFSPMDEHLYFAKGDHFCRFALDGKNCGIIICYDVRFPELTRKMAVEGLDCLFVVAQWPDLRIPHLQTLIKARAIENQIFVVCCNSCGRAGDTVYGGRSMIVDPLGKVLASADGAETFLSAECDFSVIENVRNSINVFADRRVELYND